MTPFILAGAMSPATVAATCAQNARGIPRGHGLRPARPPRRAGRPRLVRSSMSMQSGAPTFGTPEPALVLYTMASLARRLGVPFRSGGALTASKIPDAQAAYESANTMQPTMLGSTNFVLHAAGWLEGGLTMGYEKFVLDADQLGMWHAFAKGVDLSENGQALDAFLTNEPAHALPRARAHARELRDSVLPLSRRGQLELRAVGVGGGERRRRRANAHWKRALAEYEPPPLDDAIREELEEWIEQEQGVVPGLGRMTTRPLRAPPASALRGDPAGGSRGAVLEHVPREVTVTVTTSPKKGLELELVEQIAAGGYDVVPHLAARHVRDSGHLAELVERLQAAGATDVLVMAGDAPVPAGVFDGALPLLEALAELGSPFANVGMTGYPESHVFLSDDAAARRCSRRRSSDSASTRP